MPSVLHNTLNGVDLHPSKIEIVTGTPAGTPQYIGQSYWDQVGKKLYVAVGTVSAADWSTTSPSALSITNSPTITLSLTGPINAQSLRADVILSQILIPSSQVTDFQAAVSANPDVQSAIANTHAPVTLWTAGAFTPTTTIRGLELNATTQVMRLSQDLGTSGNPTFATATLGTLSMQNQGAVRLLEQTANGTQYVELRGPAAITTSYTVSLPDTAPMPGTALTFDGLNYVWASPSGSGGSSVIGNGVNSPADVTGLLFDGNIARSAEIKYNVHRQTDVDEFAEAGTIRIVYKTTTSTWEIDTTYAGKGWVEFSVTGSGQVQYTSTLMSGTGYQGLMKFTYSVLTV